MVFSFGQQQQFEAHSEAGFVMAINGIRQQGPAGLVAVYAQTPDSGWLHICQDGWKFLHITRRSTNEECRHLYRCAQKSLADYQVVIEFCGGVRSWLAEPNLKLIDLKNNNFTPPTWPL